MEGNRKDIIRHYFDHYCDKFTPEQAVKPQTGSRGIALLFNLGTRWG